MTTQNATEPDYAIIYAGRTDAPVPYYIPDIRSRISPAFKDRLIHSFGIPPENFEDHCQHIRDKAWSIRAYPCIGVGALFWPLSFQASPAYPLVLKKLHEGPDRRFLDVGCFLAIDLRFLLQDLGGGDEARKLVGLDIVDFWGLGCELFHDKGGIFDRDARFISADFMDAKNSDVSGLAGTCDIVNISAVLHQFDYAQHVEACIKLVEMTRKERGAIVMGNQVGLEKAGERTSEKTHVIFHDEESWKGLWKEVGEKTGTKWEVNVELKSWGSTGFDTKLAAYLGPDSGMLFWWSVRLE
jgi:SAM-dependent methyltransferase